MTQDSRDLDAWEVPEALAEDGRREEEAWMDPGPMQDPWMGRVVPKRIPIVGLALAGVLGTWIGFSAGSWIPGTAVALVGLILAVTERGVKKRAAGTWLALTVTFMVFWANAWLDQHPRDRAHLLHQVTKAREHVALLGMVDAEPEYRVTFDGTATNLVFPLAVEGIRTARTGRYGEAASGWDRAVGTVRVSMYEVPGEWWADEAEDGEDGEPLRYGDRFEVEGVIMIREGPGARLARSRQRLTASRLNRVARDQGNVFLATCYGVRQWAARTLGLGIGDDVEAVGVLRAMILGYRSEIPWEQNQRFARTGTLHVFAISGLHVGIVAMFVIFGLRMAGVSRLSYVLFLSPALMMFVVCTGLKASAIRAGLMAVLFWLGPFLYRRPDTRAAISLAALLILWVAPGQLRTIGFVFSFLIVIGIVALYPLLYAPFVRLGLPDPWAVVEETVGHRRRMKVWRWFAALVAVSVAAWLMSMPLTAYYFNLMSPGGLVANLFVMPAATVLVLLGMASLAVGWLLPWVSGWINEVASWVVHALLAAIDVLYALPASWWFVVAPPVAGVVFFYALLSGVVFRKALGRFWWSVVVALVLGFAARVAMEGRAAKVDFLAFDRGQAQVLHTDVGSVLVDCGPAFRAFEVQRALRKSGVNRLRAVVLTHADSGHVSGFAELAASTRIEEVWIPETPLVRGALAEAVAICEERGIPVKRLRKGDAGAFSADEGWEVLHPDPAVSATRADDHSLVFRWDVGGRSVLICGGAASVVEDQWLADAGEGGGALPHGDVVLLGHSLDADVGRARWLKSLEGACVVVPPQTFRQRGTWNFGLLDRLEAAGREVIRLDETGSVRVWVENGSWRALPER